MHAVSSSWITHANQPTMHLIMKVIYIIKVAWLFAEINVLHLECKKLLLIVRFVSHNCRFREASGLSPILVNDGFSEKN